MTESKIAILSGTVYLLFLLIFSGTLYLQIFTVQSGIVPFLIIISILCISYSSLLYWNPSTFYKFRIPIFTISILAKVLLADSNSLWEDDWARYLWEGHITDSGISPFDFPPSYFFNLTHCEEMVPQELEILSRINHPDWTSIYSPLLLFYFSFLGWIKPFSLALLKLSYLIFDLFVFFILYRLKNLKTAFLYFLFPILIKEIYINAHFEILCIFLLVLSFYLYHLKKFSFSILIFAFAVHLKIFLIIFLPSFFFLFIQNSIHKQKTFFWKSIIFLLIFSAGFLSPVLIFHLLFTKNESYGLATLLSFAKEFEFNSLIFLIFRKMFGNQIAIIFSNLILISFLLFSMKQSQIFFKSNRRSYQWFFLSFTLFLLVSPIANPWYFLIQSPFYFLAFRRGCHIWLTMALPQLAYLTFTNLKIQELGSKFPGFYNLPEIVQYIEILGIISILFLFHRKLSILLYIISNIANTWSKVDAVWKNQTNKMK